MDSFSLAVGVAGLVGLIAKTVKVSAIFVQEARRGREAAAELLKELDNLSFNLQRLDEFLRTTDQLRGHFSDTSVLVSSTFTCRTKLTILHDKLVRANSNRSSLLTWPLDAKEHHETKETLRAYTQCCQFSLTISGCMLLSNSSIEVRKILKQQLETFQLLERFDVQARSLEQTLVEQAQVQKKSHAAVERGRVLQWMSKSNHEERHHDVRSPRLEGTGAWFLDERLYQRWRDESQVSLLGPLHASLVLFMSYKTCLWVLQVNAYQRVNITDSEIINSCITAHCYVKVFKDRGNRCWRKSLWRVY